MAYARALVDGVRRGWFGEARSLKAEKLDFAKLRTQEMWPLVERCARDGTLAPALARHVALWVGQTQTNTAQNERGVKAARNVKPAAMQQNGLAAASAARASPTRRGRTSTSSWRTRPPGKMRDATRCARRGRRSGRPSRRRCGSRATSSCASAPSFEDELNAERADVEALAAVMTARRATKDAARAARQTGARGHPLEEGTTRAPRLQTPKRRAAPRGAAPAPAPAAAQDLAEANDHVVLCRLAPALRPYRSAAELYINRASGGDRASRSSRRSSCAAPRSSTLARDAAPECLLRGVEAFTFERDALRRAPRRLARLHLGQCLADLAAETDARNHEVLRCLGPRALRGLCASR